MKNNIKHVSAATILLASAGVLVALPASDAIARGVGASGVGASGVGASIGASSGVHGNFGGNSSNNISVRGAARTNGPNATDRDFGFVHAQDHMSVQGRKHNKAHLHAHTTVDADHDADD